MKKLKKIIVVFLLVFLLTGCTKQLVVEKTNENGKNTKVAVKYEKGKNATGQTLTKNIICKPENKELQKLYKENGVKIDKLENCKDFSLSIKANEGLWDNLFIKPLSWLIIKIGYLVKNFGLSVILVGILIRLVLFPVTKKSAMQSENLKKAQPELQKLEKKYANKTTTEDQQKKAQEMLLIYQKYQINPMSGCLLAFLQLPLLLAFYEAINRTPAIFEDTFLTLKLGMTPSTAIAQGQYQYIILIVLILATTYLSFNKTMKDQSTAGAGAPNMKFTLYFMLFFIGIASFSLASALGVYWIVSSLFTIAQNIYVERKKK